jgi:hypothetical protein
MNYSKYLKYKKKYLDLKKQMGSGSGYDDGSDNGSNNGSDNGSNNGYNSGSDDGYESDNGSGNNYDNTIIDHSNSVNQQITIDTLCLTCGRGPCDHVGFVGQNIVGGNPVPDEHHWWNVTSYDIIPFELGESLGSMFGCPFHAICPNAQ